MNMFRKAFSAAALSGLILAATPSLAEGKGDRADKAIAEAQGKVDVAAKLPGVGEVSHLQADASAALRDSREARSSGHKEAAINLAMKASELSDRAVAEAQRNQSAQADARSADVAAAQANAASANERAATAEAAASSAAADAAAARAAPPVVVAAPQPTAVTTETTKSTQVVPATKRKVVVQKARPARAVTTEKTTTTVAN